MISASLDQLHCQDQVCAKQRADVKGRFVVRLSLICLIGIIVRLTLFPRYCLHTDEYLSLFRSWLISQGDVFIESSPSQKPPLFYFILATLYSIFGFSKTIALVPGFIASTALIPITGLIYRKAFKDDLGSLMVALLIAISPFHILLSPTILLDPLMLTLGAAAVLAACFEWPLLAGLLVGLSLLTKQQGLYFLPLVFCCLLLSDQYRRRWKASALFILGYALPLIALCVWAAAPKRNKFFFIRGQLRSESSAVQGEVLINPFVDGFNIYFERIGEWSMFLRLFFGDVCLIILVLCCFLSLWYFYCAFRQKDRATLIKLVWSTLFLGFGLGIFLLHILVRFRYVDRYILHTLPFLALGIVGILQIAAQRGRYSQLFAHGSFLLMIAGSLLIDLNLESHALVDLKSTKARTVGVFNTDFRIDAGGYFQRVGTILKPGMEIYAHSYLYPAVRVEFVNVEILRSLDWPIHFLRKAEKEPVERIVIWPMGDVKRLARLKVKFAASSFELVPAWEPDEEIGVFWIRKKI